MQYKKVASDKHCHLIKKKHRTHLGAVLRSPPPISRHLSHVRACVLPHHCGMSRYTGPTACLLHRSLVRPRGERRLNGSLPSATVGHEANVSRGRSGLGTLADDRGTSEWRREEDATVGGSEVVIIRAPAQQNVV